MIRHAYENGIPEVVPLPEIRTKRPKGKPRPLPLPVAKPFPVHAFLPIASDDMAVAAAAIGCDPSYTALPLLCRLTRAIDSERVIRLKLN